MQARKPALGPAHTARSSRFAFRFVGSAVDELSPGRGALVEGARVSACVVLLKAINSSKAVDNVGLWERQEVQSS